MMWPLVCEGSGVLLLALVDALLAACGSTAGRDAFLHDPPCSRNPIGPLELAAKASGVRIDPARVGDDGDTENAPGVV